MRRTSLALFSFAVICAAQTNRTVQASGNAILPVNPNQASIEIGVITTGATAQDSAQQNATQSTAVLNAVKAVLGGTGTVQTLYYSVSPRYTPNSATISGYTTNNTLRATTSDLSLIGRLIDAANGAGANTVGSLSFGLQDPDPYVQQALTAATKQAMAHAAAIAGGLGGKAGAVITAQEGTSYTPILVGVASSGAAGAATPVQTGTVNVYATVTLVFQLQ